MATVSAWAKPGAWALDSEEHEAMEAMKKQQAEEETPSLSSDFPSLEVAASAKASKKKKGQKISLAEFTTGNSVSYGSAKSSSRSTEISKGLTPDELRILPTGPRERTAEELERSSSRIGGGFRNYGGGYNRSSGGEDSNSRWGSSRVSDDSRRNSGLNRESEPSRADETDDWGAGKKSMLPSFERREKGGFFDTHSRADEIDNWAMGKKSSVTPPTSERRERGGFFDSQSRAGESNNWIANKSFAPSSDNRRSDSFRDKRGGFDMFQKGGSNSTTDSDLWGKKKEEGSRRPRIVLQPRTLPVNNVEQQPSSGTAKNKGCSPFGEARPREEVLAEKGQDWKKIDEQLESMKLKEMGSSGDGQSSSKRSFGSGNGRSVVSENWTERNWRKQDFEDASATPRSEKSELEVADN